MMKITAFVVLMIGIGASSSMAQQYAGLGRYAFKGAEGAHPHVLVTAPDNTIYMATKSGGNGYGTLVRYLTDGTVQTLYTFNNTDGSKPARLMRASNGDFYGFTSEGDNLSCLSGTGCGVIFKYSAAGQFTALWKFGGQPDGAIPTNLILHSDGNLYGTTRTGGNDAPDPYYYAGTHFQITPGGSFQVIHTWCSRPNCSDGYGPQGLTEGLDHHLYGMMYAFPSYLRLLPKRPEACRTRHDTSGSWPPYLQPPWMNRCLPPRYA